MKRIVTLPSVLIAAVLALLAPAQSRAEYPDKPIRLVLPFPAGGAVDVVGRMFAAKMSDDLGKPIIIENKSGASGVIATDAVAKAPPDGYTLLLTTPNHTIIPALLPSLPYDPQKDLAPVSLLVEVPEVLVSHPSAPFTDFAGLVDLAKKNPGVLNYASAGTGTLPHITMELLLERLGIKVEHIPYRGAAPAMADLLAGVVQLKLDTYTTSNTQVVAGKLRMLGTASPHRSKLMPDVPTIAEMGLPGYEGILWIAIMAPAGTPKAVIDRLAAASAKAARDPDIVTQLQSDDVEIIGSTPAALGEIIARELPQWRDVAKTANIKLR